MQQMARGQCAAVEGTVSRPATRPGHAPARLNRCHNRRRGHGVSTSAQCSVRHPVRAAGDEEWKKRRLAQLRGKAPGGLGAQQPPRHRQPSAPPRQKRQLQRQRAPPPPDPSDSGGWAAELQRRVAASSDTAPLSPPSPSPVPAAPMIAKESPPDLNRNRSTTPASSISTADDDDEDRIPSRLKRSAIPKPYQLPATGRASSSNPNVIRSTKRRSKSSTVKDAIRTAAKLHEGEEAAEQSQRRTQPITRRARQRASDGGASLFADSLRGATNYELEKILYADSTVPNRACLGQGRLHWYKLMCQTDQENRAVSDLQRAGVRAVLPLRKEKHVPADGGRVSWRKVKYEGGAALLILCELKDFHVDLLSDIATLSHSPSCFAHYHTYSSVSETGTFVEPVTLPRPLLREEINEVLQFESSGPPRKAPTDFSRLEEDRFRQSGYYSPLL